MSIKKINVVFYEPYPMGLGGNYLTQRLILDRIDSNKFTPIVLSPIDGAALDKYRDIGVECVVITPSERLNQYGKKALNDNIFYRALSAFDLVLYNLKLRKFLKEREIDIIYTNCVRAQLSIGFAAIFANIPTFLYVKGVLSNPLIDRLCYFMTDKILFFCEQNRDDQYPILTRFFSKKIGILRIGLDANLINQVKGQNNHALRKELDIKSDCLNTAIVAQLYPPKGQHFVIEAMSKLIRKHPNIRLYILGDHVIDEYASYKDTLIDLVEKYNLTNNVFFTGWRSDTLRIVNLMDIVIHPSLAEGFGRAVLESMALGKPVIASAVGGLREAIQDGENGYLVSPGDVDAITTHWSALISDQSLRKQLGKNAKQTVFTNYLIDDKVDKLSKIWTSMVKRNN